MRTINRKQLTKILSDTKYRDEVLHHGFDLLHRQQVALQEVTAKQYANLQEWAKLFYNTSRDSSTRDLGRIDNLEKKVNHLSDVNHNLVESNHAKDIALNSNKHLLEQCNQEYNQLVDETTTSYKYFNTYQQEVQNALNSNANKNLLESPGMKQLTKLPIKTVEPGNKKYFEFVPAKEVPFPKKK